MMTKVQVTFDQPDFLAVGCFGWGRAKTAREAFRVCVANASPNYVKPEFRFIKIWRLADQIDQVQVDDFGGWNARWGGGVPPEVPGSEPAARLVANCKPTMRAAGVPELPIDAIQP